MRALVVDDEELARLTLCRALESDADVEVVGQAADGVEAVDLINRLRPDVVFLDIEMPGLNGFEVLSNLIELPIVVFATAYDEYAVRAFETNAADYLLKPFSDNRVQQTLDRVRGRLKQGREEREASLKQLLAEFQDQRREMPQRLAVRKGKRIVLVPIREIVRVAVEDSLVHVHTATERYLSDKTILDLESILSRSSFFRISRREIVNLEQVVEIIPWFSGTAKVKLINGLELDVSRERSRQLRELLRF